MAAITAVSTAIAVTKPRVDTSGMPATASDTSAITTVVPANTIALPDVATARAIDSWRPSPRPRCSRYLLTRNSA